ncbi:MAG TPA: cytochrome C oxidase subunit IV family protein [Anaerolineae bacterium]|nr:cytochrome C oxidase subunit IV family protein [Anaerolineae bacterium]
MAETSIVHRRPNYILVFVFLGLLTAVEVGVAFIGLLEAIRVPLLVALAIAKATLVGMYYMHLRFEGRVLRFIAVGPLLLAIILTLPPLVDSISHH